MVLNMIAITHELLIGVIILLFIIACIESFCIYIVVRRDKKNDIIDKKYWECRERDEKYFDSLITETALEKCRHAYIAEQMSQKAATNPPQRIGW